MADGSINFRATLDTSELRSGAAASRSAFQSIGQEAQLQGASIEAAFRKVGVTIAGVFTAQKALEFASSVVSVRKEIQSMETAFTTLLGSEEKAAAMFGEIRQFAASTPMQLGDLASGAQTLLGFNYEAEKVMPTLRALGDISMGDAEKFKSLTLAFAQMSATGKLMGQDLLQMINAGFNPLAEISRTTGKSVGELKEAMSAGAISAQMVEDAFISATNAGGKFHGMLEAQGQTLKGAIAQLQGAYADMLNEIGENSEGVIVSAVSAAQMLVTHYQEIGEAIAVLVAMYGTYKAAIVAVNTFQQINNALTAEAAVQKSLAAAAGITLSKAEATAAARTQLLNAAQAQLNKTLLANPYALAAAAAVALGYAVYKVAIYENDAEKAASKLAKASADCNAEIAAEKIKIDTLFGTLKGCTKGTKEYEQAKQGILDQYGEYLKGLKKEVAQLEDVEAAYTAIAAAAEKSAKAKAKAAYTEEAEKGFQQVYSDNADAIRKMLTEKFGAKNGTAYYIRLRPVIDGEKTLSQMPKELQKAVSSFDTYKVAGGIMAQRVKDGGNSLLKPLERIKSAREIMRQSFKDRDTLFGSESGGGKTTSETKAASVSGGGKTDKKAAEERKRIEEQTSERNKAIQQYKASVEEQNRQAELEIRRQEIENMAEGLEKEKATIQLHYDQLIAENEKRRAQMLAALADNKTNEWLNANPKASKKQQNDYRLSLNEGGKNALTTADLTADQQETLAAYDKIAQEIKDRQLADLTEQVRQSERASMQEYLKEYGDYQQKRTALTEEAQDKIAKIQARTDISDTDKDYQIKGVQQALEKSVKDLDFDKLKKDINWDAIFGDLANTAPEAVAAVKEQLEQFKAAAENLTPDQIKTVTEALRQLQDRMDLSAPIATITKARKEYKAAKQEYDKYAKAYKEAQSAGDTAKMQEASEGMVKYSQKMSKAAQRETKSYNEVMGVVGDYANALSDLGDTLGGTTGQMLKLGASAITCGVGMASGIDKFKNAASNLEKAVAVLAIIQAAIQALQIIVQVFGDTADSTLTDYVDTMDVYINLLSDSISDLSDSMAAANNTMEETIGYYERLVALEKDSATAIKSQSQTWLNSGASKGFLGIGSSSSEGVKIRDKIKESLSSGNAEVRAFYQQGYDSLNEYYKKVNGVYAQSIDNFGRMDFLWDLSDEDLVKLSEDAAALSLLGDTLSGAITEYAEKIKAIKDDELDMAESLLTVSWDDFYDDFVDMVKDMDKSSEDFANNFAEYMRDALVKNLVAEEYKTKLQNLYHKAAQYAKDGTLEDNIDWLRNQYQQYADEVQQRVETIDKITGYQEDASRDSASSSGIASASQDSVDELNARMTTVQSHTYTLNENTKTLVQNSNLILRSVQNIDGNTEDMAARLSSMEGDIRSVRNAVDDITIRGIKVKA